LIPGENQFQIFEMQGQAAANRLSSPKSCPYNTEKEIMNVNIT